MKTKTAYFIMTGDRAGDFLSNKARSKKSVRRAIKAAKRMGYKGAYAVKALLNIDCKLK